MLTQLIQLLHDKNLINTAEEVADILWLANQLKATPAPTASPELSSGIAEQTSMSEQISAPATGDLPALSPRRSRQTERRRADVYATQATAEDAAATSAARSVRLPAAPALPEALALSRALRPLMRRTRSRTRFLLDEPTTAQRIADTDDWTPVLYPEPTRWLDVALVMDESSSTSMWQRTVLEFHRLLERQGAFRSVTLWGLATGPKGAGIHLHTGLGVALERTRSRDPRELLDHRGQRLILFVSDGVAAGWRNQTIPALLADWGKQGMVALVQMLPEALWPRTGLREFPAVALRTQRAGAPNQELKSAWLFPRLGQAAPTGVALPVIPLEAPAIALWARLLAGDNRVPVRGVMLPDNLEPPKLTTSTPATAASPTSLPASEALLRLFHNNASPPARRLAAYLAALSTLTLPLVHLVQLVLLPEAGQLELAEVLLSGLIRRVTPHNRFDIPADQVEYRFLNDQVRTQLRHTIHTGATDEVRELVEKLSDYIEGRWGQLQDFAAFVEDRMGGYQIVRAHQAMAHIRPESLRQIERELIQGEAIVSSPGEGEATDPANQAQAHTTELFALLVGIDRYTEASPLSGCVNDVKALKETLRAKFGVPSDHVHILTDEQATFATIETAWQTLVDTARSWVAAGHQGAPPAFLFHFSGWSQAEKDTSGRDLDSLENFLLTHESRSDSAPLLTTRIIDQWLGELSQYSDNITLIFDTAPQPSELTPESSISGWSFQQPCTLLAAARRHAPAYEYKLDDMQFGAFTYAIVHELEQLNPATNPDVTYTLLHERVIQRWEMLHLPNDQTPVLEGQGDRLLFGGLPLLPERFFFVTGASATIRLNGGLLHGLTVGCRLRLYPFNRVLSPDTSPNGILQVMTSRAMECECRLSGLIGTIKPDSVALIYQRYFRCSVWLAITDEQIRQALLTHLELQNNSNGQDVTSFITVAAAVEDADFILQSEGDRLALWAIEEQTAIATFAPNELDRIVAGLVHLARYAYALKLRNETPPPDLDGKVTLVIEKLNTDSNAKSAETVALVQQPNGAVIVEEGQNIVAIISNHSNRTLYFGLLEFDDQERSITLHPATSDAVSHQLAAGETRSIWMITRESSLQPEGKSILKVIASTTAVDFKQLVLGPLASTVLPDTPNASRTTAGLDRIFQRMYTGDTPGLIASARQATDDWITTEVTCIRGKPKAEQPTADKEFDKENQPQFDWVTILAGEFLMGSDPAVDRRTSRNEQPQHRVNLPEYRISRVPVTVAQFAAFVQATGYITTAERVGYIGGWTGSEWGSLPGVFWADAKGPQIEDVGDRSAHPVTCISHEDVVAFCQWANVRLPTEAEWEKAARGVDGRIYPWGYELPDKSRANFNMNLGNTTPVGSFPRGASPYGLLDMAGNVWELTQTIWGGKWEQSDFHYPYQTTDGREDATDRDGVIRVVRGGAYDNTAELLRCASRGANGGPERNDLSLGFRVVALTPPKQPAPPEQAMSVPIQIDTAQQGLNVFANLLRTPEIQPILVACRRDLEAATQQLDLIGHYVNLHNLLHKLQYRCYVVIAQELPRFPQDELALENLLTYEVTLQEIVEELQTAIKQAPGSVDKATWVDDIIQAQTQLHEALEQTKSEALQRTIRLLKQVLALQPSQINHRLNSALRKLQLEVLVETFEILQVELANRQHISIAQLGEISVTLRSLNTRMVTLIDDHDNWQELERILSRIEVVISYDLDELQLSWPDVQNRLDQLCADKHDEWVTLLRQDSAEISNALTQQNSSQVQRYFRRFRQRASNQFYRVTHQIADLCTQVRDLIGPLAVLLANA